MRRDLVLMGIALLVGGALGTIAILDPGYVRIESFGWVAESNLIVFFGLLVFAYFILRALVKFIAALVHSGASFRGMRERYRFGKAMARARSGILQFAAGHWKEAAEQLAKAAGRSNEPVTIWLSAASAARKAGDSEQMNHCIAEARKLTGDVAELSLLEARWQIEDGDAQKAVSALRQMEEPKDAKLAGRRQLLLADAFYAIEDWESLSNTLSSLAKAKSVEAGEYRYLEIAQARTALDALEQGAQSTGTAPAQKEIDAAWKQVPKALRNEPSLVTRKKEIEDLKTVLSG